MTFNELENIKGKHKLAVNVYIPKEDGKKTEIDLIFIHETGIYVIESKNYSGWIFGNEKSQYWTQSFETGRKERFYNPIWQNKTHIKYLAQFLKEIQLDYFKSIIVFSKRCTLKKVEVYSGDTKVIKRSDLSKTIETFFNSSRTIFSEKAINDIYNSLKPYKNVTDEIKNNHIKNIKEYKKQEVSYIRKSNI